MTFSFVLLLPLEMYLTTRTCIHFTEPQRYQNICFVKFMSTPQASKVGTSPAERLMWQTLNYWWQIVNMGRLHQAFLGRAVVEHAETHASVAGCGRAYGQ